MLIFLVFNSGSHQSSHIYETVAATFRLSHKCIQLFLVRGKAAQLLPLFSITSCLLIILLLDPKDIYMASSQVSGRMFCLFCVAYCVLLQNLCLSFTCC